MRSLITGSIILAGLFFSTPIFSHPITEKNLQAHVTFLTSTPLAGRLTGTVGEKLATQYVANFFQTLGLQPAGEHGTFFQAFDFIAGTTLGKHNTLALTSPNGSTKQLTLNQTWRPLSFSDNLVFNNIELVFVGFGITLPTEKDFPTYDSYHGLNVKNKWVAVFKGLPETISAAENRKLRAYASLRHKAFTAKEHGATGIIFISRELIPLSADTALSGSGIAAISMTQQGREDLLNTHQPAWHVTGQIDLQQKKGRGQNVLAKLIVNKNAAQTVIVSAHIDHLGHGELGGSLARGHEKGLIHCGADDNASGVAALLEAAAQLADLTMQGKLPGNKNIVFAAWSGEELGLLGSSYFLRSLPTTIVANINLDMIGRLKERLILQGVGSSAKWATLITSAQTKNALPLVTERDPYLPTDSTAFYLHGIPTINFFTGAHDSYHTPRDTAATLNYNGMQKVTTFLVDFILAFEQQSRPMDYHAMPSNKHTLGRGFKVYLGTIPDYASPDIIGIKLSGVSQDSPAKKAGLKAGDVIIELAGKKIHDIYDYSFVLNTLQVGAPVTLRVLRKQATVTLTIAAEART